MSSVRSPEVIVVAEHDDQRVEKGPGLIDFLRQAFGVRRRQIALKGCRLYGAKRQSREHQRPPAERIPIGADGDAARLSYAPDQFPDLLVVCSQRDVRGLEAACSGRRFELSTGVGSSAGLVLGRAG